MSLDLSERIQAFSTLGETLRNFTNAPTTTSGIFKNISEAVVEAGIENEWFIEAFVLKAISEISNLLSLENLQIWVHQYPELSKKNHTPKKIAIISAGNIPLVNFHDVLCVLISGNHAVVKLSSKDKILLPAIVNILADIEPGFHSYISFQEKIESPDALIATGSNLVSNYIHFQHQHIPKIIRKNRSSLGVITGNESQNELTDLQSDIFTYFGLGCRNISKMYFPENYQVQDFLQAFSPLTFYTQHKKFYNNYLYQLNILRIQKKSFLYNDFCIMMESKSLHGPIGVLHYEFYKSITEVEGFIAQHAKEIQCVVSKAALGNRVLPGHSQSPNLWDYSDGIDTLEFILSLSSK